MPTTDTLLHRIKRYAKTRPDRAAIHARRNDGWETYSWSEYWTAVREAAKGLLTLGHEEGDCVAIVGDNRPEWVISEFAIIALRGTPAPIYATNTQEQTAYIVEHSRAKIAICDTEQQLDKYLRCIEQGLMDVETIVVFEPVRSDDERVMTFDELRQRGRAESDAELDRRIDRMEQDDTALLIYTSGTTGVPKAVMLSHANIEGMTTAIEDVVAPVLESTEYRLVSYLPLCHVAEQLMTTFVALDVAGEVYFCRDLKQIKDHLVDVRPTVFLAVPRVWEKFQAALEARFAEATGIKAMLLSWARKTELRAFEREVTTGEPVNTLSRRLANGLVLSKLRAALGLDELVGGVSGAAPISRGTLEFFASLGIVVHEGYGMSETAGVATAQEFGRPRFGTVGQALKGVDLKIAEDGEICLRGPNMTEGYLHMPEKSAELIDDEGWLHTGDIGELDADGYLRITGRKKHILITAGGKNVAPAEMEAHLKQIPGVGQAVVVGDRKPYLSALITLDTEAVDDLASRLGIEGGAVAHIAAQPAVREYLEPLVESECNDKVARYQTIKRFEILPVEFSVEGGELTPTMKLRRSVIAEKYADEIEELFA